MDYHQEFEFAIDSDTQKLITITRLGRRIDILVRFVTDVVLVTTKTRIISATSPEIGDRRTWPDNFLA